MPDYGRICREACSLKALSHVRDRETSSPGAPAPLEKLRGLWRYHLVVKAERREAIAEAGRLLAALPDPPKLDVDPQNLL